MSFYNLVHGVTSATFFALPIIGLHPDEIPRFRDVFLKDPDHPEHDGKIQVYTRVGGGNRDCGYGEEALMAHPLFVETYDDDFDSTFGTYVFNTPDEFRSDIDLLCAGRVRELSGALQAKCRAMYPKLSDKFDELWTDDPTTSNKEDR